MCKGVELGKDFGAMEHSNPSGNPALAGLSDPGRRLWLQGGLGGAMASLLGPMAGCALPPQGGPRLGFTGVPASTADAVTLAPGYVAQVLAPWGDPVGIAGAAQPPFRPDAGNTADEQALQLGMHHDGMAFFALDETGTRGLLVINHEYADEGLLHADSAARAAFYKEMWYLGVFSTNDIRALEELPPVEGGDVRYRPLNMGELGSTDTNQGADPNA